MKKTILSIAALALASVANAQILDFDGMPPYKLGITAGLNVASFSAVGFDHATGVQAGFDLMIDAGDILPNTHLRTQLKYSMMGAKGPETLYIGQGVSQQTPYNVYYTSHYVSLPIHYGYSWRLADEWTVLAETGPYFAVGLGGTGREEGKPWPESHSFFKYYDASRFDFGWGVQAGVLFNQQLMFNVGYDWGFKNITPDFLQNTNLHVGLTLFIE